MEPEIIGAGLGRRLRDLLAALDRLDGFAFRAEVDGGDGRDAADADLPGAAREMVLRALRTASDPVNDRIMRLAVPDPVEVRTMARELSLPRAAAWERVGDLVQVGLAERSLDGDRMAITAAGRALLELVEELASAALEASAR
jgi:hypothetical protein